MRKFVQDVGVLTAANIVGAALSIVQGLLVARWLGPELYGATALVMAYPALIYILFDARSVEASMKFVGEFHARDERDRVLATCKLGYAVDFASASLAFVVVLATASWAAESVAHRPEATELIILYAAAFVPGALVSTSYAILATLGRFPIIALIDTITCIVRVGLVLSFILLGWQLTGVVLGNAIATVFTGLLYGTGAHVLTRSRWNASWLRGTWQALRGRRREILGFLAYNDLNALFGLIPKQLDVVLLGYFRSPSEVGYYKLAKSLAGVVGNLVSPLQWVTYPELVRLWELGDRKELRHRIDKLVFRVALPLALATLASIPFVAPILTWLAGKAYLPAVLATQFLLVNMAVWLTFFWLRPLYLSTGCVKSWMTGIAVYACCFLVVAFPTAQFGGYISFTAALVLVNGFFHIVMAVMALNIYHRGHDE